MIEMTLHKRTPLHILEMERMFFYLSSDELRIAKRLIENEVCRREIRSKKMNRANKQSTFLMWDNKQKRLAQFTNISYIIDDEDENIFGEGE